MAVTTMGGGTPSLSPPPKINMYVIIPYTVQAWQVRSGSGCWQVRSGSGCWQVMGGCSSLQAGSLEFYLVWVESGGRL